jgi:uncharacterized membrane protein YkoI
MKTKHLKLLVVLLVAGLAVCLGAVATQKIMDSEREVSLAEVPDAVRATLLAQAQGNPIKEIEVETENGQTVYEAEVIAGGQTVDIAVAADGTFLGQETEDEDDDDGEEADDEEEEDEELVSLDQVPQAVKATIAKEAGGAEIREIEKETEEGRTIYSVEVVVNGQEVDLEIAPDGTFLGREAEDEDDDK